MAAAAAGGGGADDSLRHRRLADPLPASASASSSSSATTDGVSSSQEEPDKKEKKDTSRTTSDDEESSRAPAFLGLSIALCFVAVVLYFSSEPLISPKLWTKEELSKYNASNEELPILLGILGSVFDVSKGRSHYGVGGSYNHFAGRDATRAFVSGNFSGDGLTDSVVGLSTMEIKSLVDWRSFYNKTYIYRGKLVGTYYDSNGNETKALRKVEAKAKLGEKLLKQQEAEEKKYPICNSRWSQQHGGEVWCDSGYPRLVEKVGELPLTGKKEKRCACFPAEQLGKNGLEVYQGCDPLQSTCKLS